MRVNSPYPSMNEGAAIFQKGENVKLLLRHSIRPSLKKLSFPDEVGLTFEGKDIARKLGESLDIPLGVIMTSPVRRCKETVSCILSFHNRKDFEINDILGYSFVEDEVKARQMFSKYNLKTIVNELGLQGKLPGFYPMDVCVAKILDLIFSTGGEKGKLDVYCTHDFTLALLEVALFNKNRNISEISLNWPHMLEGMWFSGERHLFLCSWRNQLYLYDYKDK